MKKYLILLFLFAISSVYAVSPVLNFNISSYYDSNVIKLSEAGKDNFLNNYNSEKYNIQTLDDWVTKFTVGIGLKNKFPKKHIQIIKLNFVSANYYKNSVKSNVNFNINFKQFLSKRVNFSFAYQYFPKIYLRKYISEFDNSETYHNFSYAKNRYSLVLSLKPIKIVNIKSGINFDQLYYNSFFTEYDADNTEKFIKITINSKKTVNIFVRYGYKISKQINNQENGAIKDPSYRSNIFNFGFGLKVQKFDYSTLFKYEEVFFSSENSQDNYHFKRNDYKSLLQERIGYKFNDKYKLSIWGEYEKRLTNSPFETVETDKSYKIYRTGIKFGITLF